MLPLYRRVCLAYRSVAAGTALVELLDGVAVEPVLTDSDRVVLAPARTSTAATATPKTATPRPGVAFVSAGVRLEHNRGTISPADRNATLPMIGAAFVQDFGPAALKFRAAYSIVARPRPTPGRPLYRRSEAG